MKKIVFYQYGSICEPYMYHAFERLGYEVFGVKTDEMDMEFQPKEPLLEFRKLLREHRPDFAFSIDFYPQVSDLCQEENFLYMSFTVNSPINTLFSPALQNKNNRTFLFDRAQYNQFRNVNPDCIFYKPLASPVVDFQRVIQGARSHRIENVKGLGKLTNGSLISSGVIQEKNFQSEVSFVGSLYTQSDEYVKFLPYLEERTRGFLDGLLEAQTRLPGGLALKDCITEDIVKQLANLSPDLAKGYVPPAYVVSHYLLGKHLAVVERKRYLGLLSKNFDLDLYTNSNPETLPEAHFKGQANSYLEMPLIFANSKINISITYRAIETGLPQRIWDVLGCGGFLLTTYSEELPEYFNIGEELEIFTCEEELLEKAEFYLSHEELRKNIAKKGFEKVSTNHSYEKRLQEMIELIR